MSWEESRRKEQIFRKIKTNREVILKTVEDEDGTIYLTFGLRNNEANTEITLTFDEWALILSFLNKTSQLIFQENNKELVISLENPPISESIKESMTTPSMAPVKEAVAESVKEPVAELVKEPIAEPVQEPVAELVKEPIAEPVQEPLEDLVKEPIAESVKEPLAELIKEPPPESVKEPLAELVKEPIIEQVKEPPVKNEATPEIKEIPKTTDSKVTVPEIKIESQPTPVSEEIFKELEAEMQKLSSKNNESIPMVPAEEIITEIFEPLIKAPEKKKEPSTEETTLQFSAEDLNDIISKADLESIKPSVSEEKVPVKVTTEPSIPVSFSSNPQEIPKHKIQEPFISPPPVPKIPQPSKDDLKSLLTPIQQPKISVIDEFEKKKPAASPISAVELLDEKSKKSVPEPSDIAVLIGKNDTHLSENEKEARILAAMEEVAALMPPGPAKKFVEEMMLKRAAQTDNERPRLPQKNNQNS